ncbi:hypothetical protein F5887DRAFT_931987 [Amanita rubescens]|nr:hypothetical protein F5887DRAFT_931987 [Amanita rubescens]
MGSTADSKQAGPAKTNMRLSLISILLISFSAVSALPVPTSDHTHPSNPGVDEKIKEETTLHPAQPKVQNPISGESSTAKVNKETTELQSAIPVDHHHLPGWWEG